MTQIALMRHYPTAWNAEQRLQGRSDVPITDAARKTLRGLALPEPWDASRVISSPLCRAVETAEILTGRPVATDPRLVELSWGEWEGCLARDLLANPETGFRPTHEWDWTTRAPGGESAEDAWARVKPALAEVAADARPALLIMHKALMRLIIGVACAWTDMPEIKRGRLYPMMLRSSGQPTAIEFPVRLVPR